ncbi:hypothetical protein ACXYMN_19195 [Roseivivax sp. CAU 1753]
MLVIITRMIPNGDITIPVNLRTFQSIYLSCFLVTVVFSRYAYIESFQTVGLLETRNAELGGGGATSVITIWFYPLAIVLAFLRIRERSYLLLLLPLIVMVLIDMIALGTRNVPMFVLLFHALAINRKLFRLRGAFLAAGALVATIALFDYQTKGRSANTLTVGFDWSRTLLFSRTFDKVPIKPGIVSAASDWSAIGPTIYFTNYISHSQAEFRYLFSEADYGLFGTPDYTMDELCLVLRCARAKWQNMIVLENPSIGLYMTAFSVPLFDFGYLGTTIIVIFVGALLLALSPQASMPLLIFLGVVLAVGPVDNYIYNGLGLARFLLFLLVWHTCVASERLTWRNRGKPG